MISRFLRPAGPAAVFGFLALLLALSAPALHAEARYEVIRSFGDPETGGTLPNGRPIESRDGYLYGSTARGGSKDTGVLYRIARDGSGYRVIYDFGSAASYGSPRGPLVEDEAGLLIGTCGAADSSTKGALFQFNRADGKLTVLHNFTDYDPSGGVTAGSDGLFYGVGVADQESAVFSMARNGGSYRVLKKFTGDAGPTSIHSRLTEGSDGNLYGASYTGGGADNGGTVFRMAKSGASYRVLRAFTRGPTTRQNPAGGVIEGSDGLLYGILSESGNALPYEGAIYRMAKDGTGYRVLSALSSQPRGDAGELVEAADGRLFGAGAPSGIQSTGVFSLLKDGTGMTYLGTSQFREGPSRGMILGSDGFVYGSARNESSSLGLLYKVAMDGSSQAIIHQFTASGGQSSRPLSLTEGTDKLLYGMTEGSSDSWPSFFRMRRDGSGFQELRKFDRSAPDGDREREPTGGLTAGPDGWFYGVSYFGGGSDSGAVIRLSPAGAYEFVHLFPDQFRANGAPSGSGSGVLMGPDGMLYGASPNGGAKNGGAVWRMARDGTGVTVLHSFGGSADDDTNPSAPPILGRDSRLYGRVRNALYSMNLDGTDYRFTATFVSKSLSAGGITEGDDGKLYGVGAFGGAEGVFPAGGGIYRVNPDGTGFTVIYTFLAENNNLYRPLGIVKKPDGYFYGLTETGGPTGSGGLFRIRPDGTGFETPHTFALGAGDGVLPSYLLTGGDGLLYGTLKYGGAHTFGAVYRYGEAPEITVSNAAGADLENGSAVVDFGELESGGDAVSRTLTIRNTGELPLSLESFTVTGDRAAEFTVSGPTPGPLAPGASAELTVSLRPRQPGTGGAALRIASGDYDESVFTIALTAEVFGPEIALFDGPDAAAPEILAGQSAAIDLGSARRNTSLQRDLTLRNQGNRPLNITGITLPSGYSTPNPTPVDLPAGGSVVFRIVRDTSLIGPATGDVVIASNDTDEPDFIFPVRSEVTDPEIAVRDTGNTTAPELVSGQSAPVDLGPTLIGNPSRHEFAVWNTGTAPLIVSGISVPPGFSTTSATLPVEVPPGTAIILPIGLTAAAPGTFSGNVVIQSDDFDEPSFTFPVTGVVTSPEIAVSQGGRELASGEGPAVDFGRNVQGTPGVRSFTIANVGTAPLHVDARRIPGGITLTAPGVFPATIAPGASVSFDLALTTLVPGVFSDAAELISDDPDGPVFTIPLTGEVYIPDPLATLPGDGATALNRQTGLREQTVRLGNDTTATVPGYRILIRGLPPGVSVYNASETLADGTAVILVRQPLNPRSAYDLVLEYYSANRLPGNIRPAITVETVLEPTAAPVGSAAGTLAVERIAPLPGSGLLLEFTSRPGGLYEIQYSSDAESWLVSEPRIRAAGTRTQWIDRGPPRTSAAPAGNRFYRVREITP